MWDCTFNLPGVWVSGETSSQVLAMGLLTLRACKLCWHPQKGVLMDKSHTELLRPSDDVTAEDPPLPVGVWM